MPGPVENDFLTKLLHLQQDGSGAISSPSNWGKVPLLEIETDLDKHINELQDALLSRRRVNKEGRWHFFLGSPGNGKSAAVGKLYRELKKNGCRAETEEKEALDDIAVGEIPYLIPHLRGRQQVPHGFPCPGCVGGEKPVRPGCGSGEGATRPAERGMEQGRFARGLYELGSDREGVSDGAYRLDGGRDRMVQGAQAGGRIERRRGRDREGRENPRLWGGSQTCLR